jgi:hypothetical protein
MGSPPPRACLDARKYAELNRSILPRTTRRTRQSTLSTRAQYFAARPGERARKSKKGGRTAAFCFPARARCTRPWAHINAHLAAPGRYLYPATAWGGRQIDE